MPIAILAALVAAAAYGISDFAGGVGAARLRVAPSTLVCYVLATATAGLAVPFAGGAWSLAAGYWGALAGLLAIGGMLAFYAALVSGPISLSAPLVGVLESAVPVGAAVLLGQRLGGWTWLAIVLACAGGALVSLRLGAGERTTRRALVLSLVAGVALGGSILALDRAPRDSGLIPAFLECAVGLVVMAALVGGARRSRGVARALGALDAGADAVPERRPFAPRSRAGIRRALPSILAGVLMGAGNALLVAALRLGPLAVATVLVDLYPVATVLLAWFVARERLSILQLSGVVLAVAASALFALA